jgi:hypothetical protein
MSGGSPPECRPTPAENASDRAVAARCQEVLWSFKRKVTRLIHASRVDHPGLGAGRPRLCGSPASVKTDHFVSPPATVLSEPGTPGF